ncbi:MAG: response regulator [Spirochaetes bacterium]|nr:response regulator [Spirochaetota bacterium]
MKKKTILVIDDDSAILDSIGMILESSGYDAITARTSAEGLEAFNKKRPDLVLCDMMMERIDEGMKIIAEMKRIDKTTPVFLLSSIGNATGDNIDVMGLGFSGIFQKPVDLDNMLAVIEKQVK